MQETSSCSRNEINIFIRTRDLRRLRKEAHKKNKGRDGHSFTFRDKDALIANIILYRLSFPSTHHVHYLSEGEVRSGSNRDRECS